MLGAWETGVVGSGKQGRVQWTLKGKKKKNKNLLRTFWLILWVW